MTWPDGSKTVSKLHRLSFMVYNKTLDVPTVDSFGEQLDISHLCHTKLCINPLHLTLEKTLRKFVQESLSESWSVYNGA